MSVQRLRQTLPETVLDALTAHLAVLDGEGTIVAVNEAWRRFALRGGLRDDQVGASYLAACARGDEAAAEARLGLQAVLAGELPLFVLEYPCHAPDQEHWFRMRVVPLGPGAGAVVSHEEVTERRRLEAALEEAAVRERTLRSTDLLTGVANRRDFLDQAEQALALARHYHQPLSLILFQLDGLRAVNEQIGQRDGDQVLRRVAEVAGGSLRPGDLLARFDGATFAVLLPHTVLRDAACVGERLREAVAARAPTPGAPVAIRCAAAQLAPDEDTLAGALSRAEDALRATNPEGRGVTLPSPAG